MAPVVACLAGDHLKLHIPFSGIRILRPDVAVAVIVHGIDIEVLIVELFPVRSPADDVGQRLQKIGVVLRLVGGTGIDLPVWAVPAGRQTPHGVFRDGIRLQVIPVQGTGSVVRIHELPGGSVSAPGIAAGSNDSLHGEQDALVKLEIRHVLQSRVIQIVDLNAVSGAADGTAAHVVGAVPVGVQAVGQILFAGDFHLHDVGVIVGNLCTVLGGAQAVKRILFSYLHGGAGRFRFRGIDRAFCQNGLRKQGRGCQCRRCHTPQAEFECLFHGVSFL